MVLPIQMKGICNLKHRYAFRLKLGGKFLTSLTKLVLEAKVSICSTIRDILLLYSYKFSVFVAVVII